MERDYDVYENDFSRMIDLVEQKIDTPEQLHEWVRADLGFLLAIEFLATKYRWPGLRRRAVRLMGPAHWREGLCASHASYIRGIKVMEFEDKHLVATAFHSRLRGCTGGASFSENLRARSSA